MNKERPCGCKGCRTCLECETNFKIGKKDFYEKYSSTEYEPMSYCPECCKLYPGWDCWKIILSHPNHGDKGIDFKGVLVQCNFLSDTEAMDITKNIDEIPWQVSQSGRRKQNFGPKTNFKKRKIQNGLFEGFPKFSKFIQDRFRKVELLNEFQTIEQCTLEYDQEKGASIDPHVDDCWIWGERVVTVNCLGDSVLTLVKLDKQDFKKYNLNLIDEYKEKLICKLSSEEELSIFENIVIRIPMPNLSLIVLYGPARYQFEHSVLREDVITKRRVCLAYREFTPMYLKEGDKFAEGNIVTENAMKFW